MTIFDSSERIRLTVAASAERYAAGTPGSATVTSHNDIIVCRGEGYPGKASGALIGVSGRANPPKEYRTDVTMSTISTKKLLPSADLAENQGNLHAHASETVVAPVLLTPALVEEMIARRQVVQVIKFRTTCTDCLPNF
jgi:hypothetical protein